MAARPAPAPARDRSAGDVPLLRHDPRERRFRVRGRRAGPRRGRRRAAGRAFVRPRAVPAGPRNAHRRARHHPLGRAEAACSPRPRACAGPRRAAARRRLRERRSRHRGRDPRLALPRRGSGDGGPRDAPALGAPSGRPDRRARRGAHRRLGDARGADRARGSLCRSLSPRRGGRRAGGALMAGPWGSAADDVEAQGAIYDRRLAGRLLHFLKPYKKEIGLSILLLGVISLLEAAGPFLTKIAIDTYVKPASGHGGMRTDAARGLLLIAGAYVAVLAVGFVLRYVQSYTMALVGQRAMQDLRLTIFRHLETLTPTYFDTRPVGRILTRVTQDVAVLNELFAQGVVAVIGDLFMLAAIVFAMFWMSWKLA